MSDFSRRRNKKEFLEWVHAWMQSKAAGLESVRSLFLRDRTDKRMYEEALPVYNYVRKFYGNEIAIELAGDSGSADGKIFSDAGYLIEYVQVTRPVEKDDHHMRRKLTTGGLSAVDHFAPREPFKEYADTTSRVIERKLGYAYEDGTVLLVPLSADMVLEEESRFDEIVRAMRPIPAGHRFKCIVLMDYLGKFLKVIG